MKQRLLNCLSVFAAVILFVFCYFSDVRAEEATDTTQTIAELAAEGGYTEISLTSYGVTIAKDNQTYSEKSYTYGTAFGGMGDTTETNPGVLYKVTVAAQMTTRIDYMGTIYVYDESFSLCGMGGSIYNYTAEEKIYYVWIRKTEYTMEDSFSITFKTGRLITSFLDKAIDLDISESVICKDTDSNYLTDIELVSGNISSGCLYKNTISGRYKIAMSQSINLYYYDLNGNLTGSSYVNSNEIVLIKKSAYIFIENSVSTEFSLTFKKEKNLSELGLPVLVKGEEYLQKSTDPQVSLSRYGMNSYFYVYQMNFEAQEIASVSLVDANGDVFTNFAIYSDEGEMIQECLNGNKIVLKNDSTSARTYFVAIGGSNESFTVKYDELAPKLSQQEEKAINMAVGDALSFENNDARFIRRRCKEYQDIPEEESGAFVVVNVKAGETVKLTLLNSGYTSVSMYLFLGSTTTTEMSNYDANYVYTNTAKVTQNLYIFIPEEAAVGATFKVEETKTISYTDVDELQIGENDVTYEDAYVSYPYGSSTKKWSGKVFHLTLPDDGKYVVNLKYTDDELEVAYLLSVYTLKQGTYMTWDGVSGQNRLLDGNNNPKYTEGNYILPSGNEFWLNLTVDYMFDQDSLKTDASKIKISVRKLEEFTDEDIVTVKAGDSVSVAANEYTVGTYKNIQVNGGIYKIVVPSQHMVTIQAQDVYPQIYLKEKNIWTQQKTNGYMIENDSLNDETYLMVFSSYNANVPYNFTVSEEESLLSLIPIEDADAKEIKFGEEFDCTQLTKQRMKFKMLCYRDVTADSSTYEDKKIDGYLAAFTVPKDKVYYLDGTGLGDVTMAAYRYYAPYESYESMGEPYMMFPNTFTEGSYYLILSYNVGTLTLSEIPSIELLKDNASEITENDIKLGKSEFTVEKQKYSYCDYVSDGEKHYYASYGKLLKITISAGETYKINSAVRIYEADNFNNDPITNGYISNTSDTDKEYYIWCSEFELGDFCIYIQKQDNFFGKRKDDAESMLVDMPVIFQYNMEDSSYIETLTSDKSENVNYAKMYKLDEGFYTLETSSYDQSNAQIKVYEFQENGYSFGTTTLNSVDNTLDLNVSGTHYIAISDYTNSKVKLTLTLKKKDANWFVDHKDEIQLLQEGDNPYNPDNISNYTVTAEVNGKKEYFQGIGFWCRYTVAPYTTAHIEVPMSGDLDVYDDPKKASQYFEGYNTIYSYQYANDTAQPKDIYLKLTVMSDFAPISDKIVVTTFARLDKIENQIELKEGHYTTEHAGTFTARIPYGNYLNDNSINYVQKTGKLYCINVPKKHSIRIDTTAQEIGLYWDLSIPPVWGSEGWIEYYNLTDEDVTYYLWVDGDNNGESLDITLMSMEVSTKQEVTDDGDVVSVEETKIPTQEVTDASFSISESKDINTNIIKESIVKIEQDILSEDAIQKSIELVETKREQYETEDRTAKVSIKAEITSDTNTTISKEILNSIRKMSTSVDLEVAKKNTEGDVEYTWNFKADSIANLDARKIPKVNTKLEVFENAENYDRKDEVDKLTCADSQNCVVSFEHEGALPENTEVNIKVGSQYSEGETVFYYHLDNGALTFVGSAVVKNGYVPLTISHCSDYVISDMKVGEEVHPVEAIKISAGDTDVKNVEVASTIKLVAIVSPKNADDTSVTWSSSDDAIATVDEKTGVVTAVSQGEVTIKATANDGSDVFGEIKLKVIEKVCKHGNTEVRNAKEASCTEAGYTGDTYCVDCDTKLATGEVIAKKDHTSSDWIVDKAATVDAEGSRHKECTVCKTVLAKEAIAKLPSPTPTPDPKPTPEPVVTPDVTIRYTTHVQTFGWQGDENNANKWFVNGNMAGTSGKAKRLEGIKIRVYGNDNLGIQYTTHCQSYGWLPWSSNGEMNGTEGEAKRLEAIKIQLTGADKDKYDVYYRVHAQSYGWLGWAKNGAPSGTAGYAKRLEGIQIVVVKKGAAAPGVNYAGVNAASGVHQAKSYIAKAGSSPVVGNQATSNTNPSVAGEANVNVAYRTHVQTFGWQGWKYNGQMSGTSGQAKRLEGINIKLTNKPYSGSIVYTTHVQTYGWQGNENNPNTWKRDGDMSGTSGEAKRLEAIRIALTGEMAEHYDVYYRVHAQSFGWLGWAKNGEAAGTAGLAKRLEGIQIVLVPKGGNAPARSYQGVTSVKAQAYIKK